jgi:hypothetical protein
VTSDGVGLPATVSSTARTTDDDDSRMPRVWKEKPGSRRASRANRALRLVQDDDAADRRAD